jgi:hypothetical protein
MQADVYEDAVGSMNMTYPAVDVVYFGDLFHSNRTFPLALSLAWHRNRGHVYRSLSLCGLDLCWSSPLCCLR